MEEEKDNLTIATLFNIKEKKKNKKKNKKNKKKTKLNKESERVADDSATAPNDEGGGSSSSSGAYPRISLFDLSAENFFQDMDTIAKLCGEEEHNTAVEQTGIKRMFSSVIFLREWRDFKYPSKSIKFAYGLGSSECYERNDIKDINLPQFSSATVPKHDMQKKEQLGDAKSQDSKDFVMNVGGSVWALDWCPRMHKEADCSIKCEFIAVAAHPPGSSYHKMGASLTGRGAVQIWCLLNVREHNEEVSSLPGKEKKTKKDTGTNNKSTEIKRPRGRPRKNPTGIVVDDTNCETHEQSLTAQFAENSIECPAPTQNLENNEEISPITNKRKRGRPKKNPTVIAVENTNCETECIPSGTVQFEAKSTELPAPNGNNENNEEILCITFKSKRGPKGNEAMNEKSALIKRPRGRPKKNSKDGTVSDPNCENQFVPLAVQLPDSAEFISPDVVHGSSDEHHSQQFSNTKGKNTKKAAANTKGKNAKKAASNTKGKDAKKAASAYDSETLVARSRLDINRKERSCSPDTSRPLLIQCENEANNQPHGSTVLEPLASTCPIPRNLALPIVVSCLAHNGKVAWDVKWRPLNNLDSSCKHRMGYLAVLLGNGSLEVWEVPLPHALRAIYTHKEGTDPRFIKLEPVFKCSMLKRGSSQSIPLTVEWSVTPPHDYLLAGCHDGTVALWKFSANSSSKCDDTKPILCFGGDTVPIRTVAWAPFEGDPESSNLIVTAGHEGLKFWDLRNPFRPLRLLQPSQRIIYSLDWQSKPSCIIMCFEDGTMKTISLAKAANDLPVTGTIYTGKKQPWLHGTTYSSYAIWSVQVSRITGMVAYCGADGAAVRFQLTTKSVETDHSHNRLPFFLCGSVSEEESTIIVNTPVSNSPFPLKKPQERGRCAESFRDLLAKSRIANNQMTKASTNDCQILALCDGDSLGLESVSEEALASQEQSKRQKLSSSSKKKPQESTALACRDGAPTDTPGVDNEKPDSGSVPEVLPPKMAALHRVRWNINKGSERWLCFGGANGLIRCQEIVFSNVDKKMALKR